jgi:hypothetical protein
LGSQAPFSGPRPSPDRRSLADAERLGDLGGAEALRFHFAHLCGINRGWALEGTARQPRLQQAPAECTMNRTDRDLFLAMLLNMGLHCLFSMASSLNRMTVRSVSVVCRSFVVSSLVMLGGLHMVMRRMREVF